MTDSRAFAPVRRPAPPAATPAAEPRTVTHAHEVLARIPAATPEADDERPARPFPPFLLRRPVGDPVVQSEDAIAPVVTSTASIARGGLKVRGIFGATEAFPRFTGAVVRHMLAPVPAFVLCAVIQTVIRWQVHRSPSPGERTHVGDPRTSPVLTSANYSTAAADLTPDAGDLGGRPPRTKFWARDLTARHEQFHARDYVPRGAAATAQTAAWLGTQQAADPAGVQAVVDRVPAVWKGFMATGPAAATAEHRAYADGAPYYRARAHAIRALGDAGRYG